MMGRLWRIDKPVLDSGAFWIIPAAFQYTVLPFCNRKGSFYINIQRIDIQGRLIVLDTCLPQCYLSGRTEPNFPLVVLSALCIPYVIPSYAESPIEEQFLRSKHSLDMSICSLDAKMITLLECQESHLPQSFYSFVHSNDVALVGEAHRQGTVTNTQILQLSD